MKSSEFKRWLAEQGATFKPGKGSHVKVYLDGKNSICQCITKSLAKDYWKPSKSSLGSNRGRTTVMRYPVKITKDGKFYLATFPDIPEAVTQGRTRQEALKAAHDALESALDFYFEQHRIVPEPSLAKTGQATVALPASVWAKVLLLNEMVQQKIRPSELARRLKTRPQDVNRLTDIRHASKIDAVSDAMKALGKTLEIRAV